MDQVVLRTAGLGKQVSSPEGPLTILDDVNLEIRAGESVALVGPSGAGKTTLLALLAGLDKPSSGQVWLCGEDLTALDEDGRARLRGKRVGFVFQSFHLRAVTDGAGERHAAAGAGWRHRCRAPARARRWPPWVSSSACRHYPKQLSGGEKQRVAIARAFVTRPDVLFADEPTGNLDTASGERVAELLFSLNRQAGTTLVLVTHERVLADRCDRILEMAGGRLVP